MKAHKFLAVVYGCILSLWIPLPVSAMQAVDANPPIRTSNERYLAAELISRTDQRIVTTAGTFDIGPGVKIDERRSFKERMDAENNTTRPKVDLMFEGDRLRRVTIH